MNVLGHRVLTGLLQAFGWTLARLPVLARLLSVSVGELLYRVMPSRRAVTLSNLDHAFPNRGREWCERTARASFRRMVETALFSAALPYLGERTLRASFGVSGGSRAQLEEAVRQGRGAAIAVPHLALWEAFSLVPLLAGTPSVVFGTVYRPQRNPALESWIQSSRGRFGLRLFSKRTGLLAPARFVASGGFLGVLIDQNAGSLGALDLFLGRLASCSTLQGILVERARGDAFFAWPKRTGFWRATLHLESLGLDAGAGERSVTLAANRRLERLLEDDASACECWLWSHNRWRCQEAPAGRFRLEAKRSYLPPADPVIFPRRTRLLLVAGAGPGSAGIGALVRRLRAARPDMHVTAVVPEAAREAALGAADAVETHPGDGRWQVYAGAWRGRFLDVAVFLDAPAAAVQTARRAGVRQRLGTCTGGAEALLVPPPNPISADACDRWAAILEAYGLPAG